ncbi:MAG: translation elongation factor 4 [Candidatus Eremiobacteraeota bacterium]|nr:translation elongation factor 4 [Candidatus Eremiobacteraeota bacterium]
MKIGQENIRNFSIIAHIDHGKSTLADRLLEMTNSIDERHMKAQVLDSMDLERERGITIKATPVTIKYEANDGQEYIFNLIDTPGHVDFTYEVSRSLAACDGAILVVDAAQGVQAQTMANFHLALENDLEIMPVINKIDLPAADVNKTIQEIEEILSLPADDAVAVSARNGTNMEKIPEAVVRLIPSPKGDPDAPLKALIFDSDYDSYRGVVPFIRVFDGTVKKGDTIKMFSSKAEFEVGEVGIFSPQLTPVEELRPGFVGYLTAQIKDIKNAKVGDTITLAKNPVTEALPGYKALTPMVYAGLYPVEPMQFIALRDSLDKFKLNDAALTYEPETSAALGVGFRCGFLGLLHLEIVQERLEREFGLNLIATAPSVIYKIVKKDGEMIWIDNPKDLPDPNIIDRIEEPYTRTTLMTPDESVGQVIELAQGRRGDLVTMEYPYVGITLMTYDLPLSEIITDFFDTLKSKTRGYASMDYEITGYKPSDLVKMDILVNKDRVDALSTIVHRDHAEARGRQLVERMKEVIPRHQFAIPIQASLGARIVARSTVSSFRKNVTAGCYGGDISRKRKLLEKQKAGKKRMRQIGSVNIPQEAFLAVLKRGDE